MGKIRSSILVLAINVRSIRPRIPLILSYMTASVAHETERCISQLQYSFRELNTRNLKNVMERVKSLDFDGEFCQKLSSVPD